MGRFGFKNRLAKLETRCIGQGPNRVLHFNPADYTDGSEIADLHVWQVGLWSRGENPASGPLRAFAGRFILIPDHGTAADWEAAVQKQQHELMTLARSRADSQP